MLNQNDTRNFTSIQDKNISFDTPATEMITINGRKALIIHATLTYQPKACQKCGTINENDQVIKNGTQTSKIKLCNDHHSARYLHLRKQHFSVRLAMKPLTQKPIWLIDIVSSQIVLRQIFSTKRLGQ